MRFMLFILLPLAVCGQQAFTYGDLAMVGNAGSQKQTTAACSTFNTTNAWDDFIDGFQGATGYESNTWTAQGTVANVISNANSSSLSTYKPAGACDQALKVILPTDGTETNARLDLGYILDLDTIQTDVYFCIYVETGPDAGESYVVYTYRTGAANDTLAVTLANTAGQLTLTPKDGISINISAGQWYTVKMSYTTAGPGCSITIWSNGSQVGSTTFYRLGGDMRYLYFGAPFNLDANDSGTVWFDLISIKTN